MMQFASVSVWSLQPTGILEVPAKRPTGKAATKGAPEDCLNLVQRREFLSQGGGGNSAPAGPEAGEARTGKLSAHCEERRVSLGGNKPTTLSLSMQGRIWQRPRRVVAAVASTYSKGSFLLPQCCGRCSF